MSGFFIIFNPLNPEHMKPFNQFTLKQLVNNSNKIFHKMRWSNGIYCPKCGSTKIYTRNGQHHCSDCYNVFTDTSGTIFHSTKLSTDKILTAIYFFVSNTRGISSYQLARHISVTQKTAWILLTKMRQSIKRDLRFSGDIILDELYLGGDFRWKPLHKKLPPNIYANYRDYTTKQLKVFIQEYSAQVKMPTLGIIGNERTLFKRKSVGLIYVDVAVSKKNVKDIITPFI